MGKSQKKTGKGRLDKYYKLAKEQGYRARSAFKLVQLDKKYDILKNCRCLIDLCAAPGGWLQVATKYMPPSSIILGVDLVPIKPIPRVITFAEDITTETCRKRIREEIKDWKADVVLHDGAPNVGTAWAQDAFTQAELVLSSLKLATDFLTRGGTFVTKVFRSKDYNSLMYVFNQLFEKVEATKPPSSRNVSAEIFVVCQGYYAPKRIDPRFLDAASVFQDLDILAQQTESGADGAAANKAAGHTAFDKLTPAAMKVFHPEKKRKAREGYEDGDLILFKRQGVMDFVLSQDPIQTLGGASQLSFTTPEEKALLHNEATSGDVITSCEDLKVLGKKDFKTLLRWRSTIREQMGLDLKVKAVEDVVDNVEISGMPELTEEQQMEEDIERIKNEDTRRKRREKKKSNLKKMKEIQRLQLHMTTPMDIGIERTDQIGQDNDADFMFDLGEVDSRKKGTAVGREHGDAMPDSDSDGDSESESVLLDSEIDDSADSDEDGYDALESNLDALYDEFQNTKLERDAKHRAREARRKRDKEIGGEGEWSGIKKDTDGNESAEMSVDEEESDVEDTMAGYDASFNAIPADELESSDEEEGPQSQQRASKTSQKLLQSLKKPAAPQAPNAKSRATAMWYDQPIFKNMAGLDSLLQGGMPINEKDNIDTGKAETSDKASSSRVRFEEEPALAPAKRRKGKHVQSNPSTWEEDDEAEAQVVSEEQANAERVAKFGLTTPEAMTLAQQLVNREKTKEQLITEGFNRHAFEEKEGLPTWFLDDEMKHFRSNIPITKEATEALRAKMRALNARPIKKIAEAKARKKMRVVKRLANAQKKAEAITETDDMTEKEKAAQISRLVSRATKQPKKAKKDEIKFVVAKGSNKAVKGRPKGIKGRYRMVDSRGKKEMRALKRIEKRDGPKRRK